MADSILDSVKKFVNVAPDEPAFDQDILLAINSAFMELHQLGIGPMHGFVLQDRVTSWDDYVPANKTQEMYKMYICIRVRLLFDPPQFSFQTTILETQLKEMAWRLITQVEAM